VDLLSTFLLIPFALDFGLWRANADPRRRPWRATSTAALVSGLASGFTRVASVSMGQDGAEIAAAA
jgi:hypothetical protein